MCLQPLCSWDVHAEVTGCGGEIAVKDVSVMLYCLYDWWWQSQYCDISLTGNEMCRVFIDGNLPENHLAVKLLLTLPWDGCGLEYPRRNVAIESRQDRALLLPRAPFVLSKYY